jgi:hypothetical protein
MKRGDKTDKTNHFPLVYFIQHQGMQMCQTLSLCVDLGARTRLEWGASIQLEISYEETKTMQQLTVSHFFGCG